MSSTCLFCRIIAGERPAAIAHKDEHVTAIRDINPQAPTHILILPNRHIASVAEASAGDRDLLGTLLMTAAQIAAREGLTPNGYRLVVNHGPDAGQSVFHLHVHLLGGRRLGWPPG
jgi:histidine triad (HIT) family protein